MSPVIREFVSELIHIQPDLVPDAVKHALQPGFSSLSPRETQVFWRLCEDTPVKQIASDLGLNPKTIDTYRASIMRKIGVQSRVGLIRWAIRNRMLAA